MSHHPFKVVLFTFLFTIIPSIMAVTNEDFFYWGLSAFMLYVILWALLVWKHSKTMITAMLVMATIALPIRQARSAIYAVGAIVICVGGVCVYKMVKVCQKKFPPKGSGSETNSNSGLTVANLDEYAGAYEYSSIGSCFVMPETNGITLFEDLTKNPTTFTLNVMLIPDGVLTSMTSDNTEGTTQNWDQFRLEMEGHGLFITGHASYQPQFSRNGVPCDGASVPLSFDPFTGRVIHNTGGELKRVSIERSPNLIDWTPLLVTDVSDNTGFKVVDTTREGQMFYRVSVSIP